MPTLNSYALRHKTTDEWYRWSHSTVEITDRCWVTSFWNAYIEKGDSNKLDKIAERLNAKGHPVEVVQFGFTPTPQTHHMPDLMRDPGVVDTTS